MAVLARYAVYGCDGAHIGMPEKIGKIIHHSATDKKGSSQWLICRLLD